MREIQFKEKDRQLWWFLRHLVVIYGYINDNGTSICKKWIIIIILRIWTTATEKLMKDEYWIWIFIFEMKRFFFKFQEKCNDLQIIFSPWTQNLVKMNLLQSDHHRKPVFRHQMMPPWTRVDETFEFESNESFLALVLLQVSRDDYQI